MPASVCSAQDDSIKETKDSNHIASFSILELAIMNAMSYIFVIPNAGFMGFSPAKLAVCGGYFYLLATPTKTAVPPADSVPIIKSEPINPEAETYYAVCCSNERMLCTALELYSLDNNDQYPDKLNKLVPGYIEQIPVCPAAGADTYSSSYKVSAKRDSYSFYCKGANHTSIGVKPDYPKYSKNQGLIKNEL
jgi:hypothetical protein